MFGFAIDANGRRWSEVRIITAAGPTPAWVLGPRRRIGRFITENPSGKKIHPSGLFYEKEAA